MVSPGVDFPNTSSGSWCSWEVDPPKYGCNEYFKPPSSCRKNITLGLQSHDRPCLDETWDYMKRETSSHPHLTWIKCWSIRRPEMASYHAWMGDRHPRFQPSYGDKENPDDFGVLTGWQNYGLGFINPGFTFKAKVKIIRSRSVNMRKHA